MVQKTEYLDMIINEIASREEKNFCYKMLFFHMQVECKKNNFAYIFSQILFLLHGYEELLP